MDDPNHGDGAGRGVVFHLDEGDPEKQGSVMRNVSNLLGALGAATVVELVTHGPGVDALLAGGPNEQAVRDLLAKGVQVSACANTMGSKQIGEDALVPGVRVVPSGVAQVVVRQREGWSYVRP